MSTKKSTHHNKNNNTIVNRNEILFLYDIKDANPNGDPYENKPRVDEETGLNLVTDTRLKRTIRDYLESYKEEDIFITLLNARKEDSTLKSRRERLDELKINKSNKFTIFEKYIDLRLFGAFIAYEKKKKENGQTGSEDSAGWVIAKPGPVQFNFGRSLNRVKVETIRGTTVLPSQPGLVQGTFTDTSIVHYSLICFHGIVNEKAAEETKLTEDDLNLLYDALWNGTKNLITRSKAGQEPRLLLRVMYKVKEFHIGDLHKYVKATYNSSNDLDARDIKDVNLDVSELTKTLVENAERIEKVQIKIDSRLLLTPKDLCDTLKPINVEEFGFA